MNINIAGLNVHQAARRLDLSRLPATHHDRGSRGIGIFLVLFSLVWGGIPGVIVVSQLMSGDFDPGMYFLLLFPFIGTGLFLFGLRTLSYRETIHIDPRSVSFESRSLFGRNSWMEPLHRYPGIVKRTERRSGGKNRSSYTLHIAELHHPDKKKRVRLYESRSNSGFRQIWEDYCRQLNLPALEGDTDNLVSRAVEDLDKSVRDLAGEGKLKVDFDPRKPPPAGFELRVDGEFLRVTLPKARSSVIGTLFVIAFACVFIFIGFGIDDAPVAFGIIGVLFLLLVLGGVVWSMITRQALQLGRDRIRIFHETPWGDTNGRILDSNLIETVRIGGVRSNNERNGVLLVTDETTGKIGEGLPPDVLEWLKNCVLAVITR
ncbi:MAG: hypothetical protein R6U28_05030 [Cyclonatronaceae bacterium]